MINNNENNKRWINDKSYITVDITSRGYQS
jgi:hypothetical protein